ncbi:hypothetical protein Y032_0197g1557 [Ancylostoma ceylanicum]|uniref:Uncharacterized protein n=1 Tax=Ancylostoma ceylanicum TaxID=53326 RepID=A0A016SP99_9BILA|nr:hypothetical protein Y032_0197g1557 [Ancylostoma ceylanicum]
MLNMGLFFVVMLFVALDVPASEGTESTNATEDRDAPAGRKNPELVWSVTTEVNAHLWKEIEEEPDFLKRNTFEGVRYQGWRRFLP